MPAERILPQLIQSINRTISFQLSYPYFFMPFYFSLIFFFYFKPFIFVSFHFVWFCYVIFHFNFPPTFNCFFIFNDAVTFHLPNYANRQPGWQAARLWFACNVSVFIFFCFTFSFGKHDGRENEMPLYCVCE